MKLLTVVLHCEIEKIYQEFEEPVYADYTKLIFKLSCVPFVNEFDVKRLRCDEYDSFEYNCLHAFTPNQTFRQNQCGKILHIYKIKHPVHLRTLDKQIFQCVQDFLGISYFKVMFYSFR